MPKPALSDIAGDLLRRRAQETGQLPPGGE
jgi:hypothetical protein